MEHVDRRKQVLEILHRTAEPVSGNCLGEILDVSRQVIVQDIALLRAKGVEILATPQGYMLNRKSIDRPRRVIAVKHDPNSIEEELRIIVNLGGKVIDVSVEHPIYGEIKGMLMLGSMADLEEYMSKYRLSKAEPLSALTGGVHLHTIEAENEHSLDRIIAELKQKGFLLEDQY